MVNMEKTQLSNQNESMGELLGLLDYSEDEHLSTDSVSKHDTKTCHIFDNSNIKLQDKTEARRKLLVTCAVCLIFMIGEIIGGYIAHSLAIMTDAAHLLADFFSVSISLFSLWISARPPSKHLTFGWHRSEALGALLSVLSIWLVTVVLVVFAAQRIISDDYEIHGDAMIVTAGCAVSGYDSPSVSISSFSSSQRGQKHQRQGGICSRPGRFTAELRSAAGRHSHLLQGIPNDVDFDAVNDALLSVGGVKSTHRLHMWSLNTSQLQLSVHVVIEAQQSNHQMVLKDMTKLLQAEYGFTNITIQLETHPAL
ncbi:hypothetical protein DNTS_016233 [Danionella cerebrum]|uniref:Zinc transporter 8 n=1 Tax=Danionella cerebrum TaxID=2873325 RepID=A0A553Q0N9_9TELE|nr:hypothetical protein DNTS_016233 [Danionella translucida]